MLQLRNVKFIQTSTKAYQMLFFVSRLHAFNKLKMLK